MDDWVDGYTLSVTSRRYFRTHAKDPDAPAAEVAERARRYHAQHKLPMDMLYDRKGDASEAYEAPATSYIVVVNKAGKVVYTGLGGKQDIVGALKKAGL